MTRSALLLFLAVAACKKSAPADPAPDAAPPPPTPARPGASASAPPIFRPTARSPFAVVATFAEGVSPSVHPLGDAVAVLQFGPTRWTLSAARADQERVDLMARIPPAMRPLDEQPMFVGGSGVDDVWLSTATGTLHVTPRATAARTGHILTLGPVGAGFAALFLDGEERSLDWLVAPGGATASVDAGALPKLPPAHRLSDDVAFLGEGRICGRSDMVVWTSAQDGTRSAVRLDPAHRDGHVYRGPGGECLLHQEDEDTGTELGRIRGDAVAWTKIAPGRLGPVSVTRAGALVFATGEELVRASFVNGEPTLTAIPLPDDAKRVTTLVAIDDDDIWFTGPRGPGREALYHTSRLDGGAAPLWPAP